MLDYNITLINLTDGSVAGHGTACSDIARSKKNHADRPWNFWVSSKEQARAEYNADFDIETDGWYDIDWLPCADHVPATAGSASNKKSTTPKKSNTPTNKENNNMSKSIITLPGLFNDDMAFIAQVGKNYGVAVNKTFVLTTDLEEAMEWFGNTTYTVANVELPRRVDVDEVIDLADSGIDSKDKAVAAFQSVAQLVLEAGEPGPRAVKYLEQVLTDEAFAARQIKKGVTEDLAVA